MKTEEERPNAMPPWGLTVGAIFAHFSFVISDPKDNFWLTIMFGVSMVSLSLWAINDWKKYFEDFVHKKIESSSQG
jgi:hypothetical protein